MPIDTLTLPDGRRLEVRTAGPDNALPLVYHHGTPGDCVPPRFLEREVLGRGLRLVTFSRPGYGGSARRPNRTVAEVVSDTAAVLESVGASSCLVAGWSGGGPHALACAEGLLGVRAALVIAGVGPHHAADLDFFAGMGTDNLEEFGAARNGEAGLRAYLDGQTPALLHATPAGVIDSMASLLPDEDRAVLTAEYGEDVASSFGRALATGPDGWIDDDLAFMADWGFDLGSIRVPVQLWQGRLDRMVPAEHTEWLAAHVPGAAAHVLDGEGHLSLVVRGIGRMLDALVASARR